MRISKEGRGERTQAAGEGVERDCERETIRSKEEERNKREEDNEHK